MNRRNAISAVAGLLGGTLVGGDLLLSCVSRSNKVNTVFDQDQVSLLDEIGETILPATKTPGAKAAQIGEFMVMIVEECYTPEDQHVFLDGLTQVNTASNKKYGKDFMNIDAGQRTELLIAFDHEQRHYMKNRKSGERTHYFRMMKELTLLGYFTSEVGATQALRYVPVPGRYDGCISYTKGERAWSS
jgi:hypothetical protein